MEFRRVLFRSKAAILRCVEMIEKMDFPTATMDAVRNAAEFSLGEFYKDHIYTHPDRAPEQVFMQMLVGKRPEFPSGMSLGARANMPSWLFQRKRALDDRFAVGERCRRS